jgi:glutathione S-transferase
MILYSDRFWISPWVFTCWVTLKEKGVKFEVADIALDKKETHKPEYRKNSTTAKVPAIEDDGFWIAESQAILEYLEEKFPTPRAFPADLKDRARARQVMSFLRTDVYALREERSTATMFYERATAPLSKQGQADADKLIEVASAFVKETSLFGQWCIADSELAFCLQRLALNGFELPAKLKKFVDAQWSRPSVAEYVAHQRAPYVPYG